MTIEHRDAYRLGHALVRLYGFNTFGIDKEFEYKVELASIYGLLQSLGIPDAKALLKPSPESDDQQRSINSRLGHEYQEIIKAIGILLQSGRSGEIYHSYCLGWYLPMLGLTLRDPVPRDEQEAATRRQSIRSACWNIRYFLTAGPQLPGNLTRKLEDIATRAESTSNRSAEAYKIIDEIAFLYNELVEAFEMLSEPQQQKEKDKIRILFLAADPTNASRLWLGKEFREIEEQLTLAMQRDRFNLVLPQLALRPRDISRALLNVEPQIVHFSGHGTPEGALCFEDESGKAHFVQPKALATLFRQFAGSVICVILNACYAEIQAREIAKYIDYVIGMNQAVSDKAAIAFSIGFYQALGAGRSIEEAYMLGCAQMIFEGIPEHLTAVLIRKGMP